MRFIVETGKIKTREVVQMQSDINKTIDIMARFACTDAGEPIDPDEAREMLLDTDLDELTDIVDKFAEAITPKLKNRR